MKANHPHQLVGLRLAVGLLGEQEGLAWWPSSFLGQHAHAFLSPIFGSKTRIAQYQGVTEAACRIHDERIGVGHVFHLYRLPEAMEQRIANALHEPDFLDDVARWADSVESAKSVLADLANSAVTARSGPVRIGGTDLINSRNVLALLAASYQAAFHAGIKCYPYFADH